MQGKIQQHIRDLMKDHKRRRVWKRATAVLSAVVLLSTFLSLRNFAIAVTEENADRAQVEQAVTQAMLDAAASSANGSDVVLSDFTPAAAVDTKEAAADDTAPEVTGDTNESLTAMEEAPEYVTEEADGPGQATEAAPDAAPDAAPNAAPAAVDIPDDIPATTVEDATEQPAEETVDAAPEAVEATETADAPVSIDDAPTPAADAPAPTADVPEDFMLRMAPMGSPAGTDVKAAPAQVTSAVPTKLIVTQNGNPVGTIYNDSLVEVEIAWLVEDSTEIDAAGDYIVMELPEQFDFPAGSGSYKLAQTTTGLLGRSYPAGTSLADYTISGNTLTLTFTAAGVDLNAAGKLTSPALMGALQWSAMKFSGVSINTKGTFTPEFVINGSRIRNAREVTVLDNKAELLTGAVITSLTLPDAERWSPYGSSYNQRSTVYTEARFTLNLAWSWKNAVQVVSDGDYFEFTLPSQLVYDTYTYTSADAYGNYTETSVYKNSAGQWVMRVTFLDVKDNYNTSSGDLNIGAYAPPSLVGNSDYVAETLQAGVTGGNVNSGKNVSIYVRKKETGGGGSASGQWYVQSVYEKYPDGRNSGINLITDYATDINQYKVQDSSTTFGPALFVIADEQNKPNLTPYPFNDQAHIFTKRSDGSWAASHNPNQKIDYVPGASNYMDAYCADRSNRQQPGGSYTRYYMAPGQRFTNTGNAGYSALSADQVNRLYKLLSHSVPYVSLESMASHFGFSASTEVDAAIAAVQAQVWNIIHGYNWSLTGTKSYTGNQVLNKIKSYVNDGSSYTPGTSQGGYTFAQTPAITFNGNTATVTGRLNGSSFTNLTGTFRNDKGVKTTINVDRYGSFTATLSGVSKSDRFYVDFNWKENTGTRLWYFSGGTYNYQGSSNPLQNMIAAEVEEEEGELCWEYQEELRDIKVVKKWIDKDGRVINSWPAGKEVTVTLYRQVAGGQPETVPATAGLVNPVTLNAARPTYTWQNLPVRDNKGNVYHYSVVETGVPSGFDYVGIETSAEGSTVVFTAVNVEKQPEKTKVQIIKEWLNPQTGTVKVKSHVKLLKTDAGDTRREQLYVKVKNTVKSAGGDIVYGEDYSATQQSGYAEASYTLEDANGWKVTFEGLPKYEADGKTLARYVFFEDYFVIRRGGMDITYYVNSDGTTYYVDESGSKKDGDFTVAVVQPVMSDADMSRIPSGVVKNTEDDADTEVTVVKKWAGIPDGKTDDYKVVVQLFRQNKGGQNHGNGTKTAVRIKNRVNTGGRNGQPLIVTGDYTATKNASAADGDIVTAELTKKDNNWRVTFKGLPKYESDGTLIQYLVRETAIYDGDGNAIYMAPGDSYSWNAQDDGFFVITYDPATADYPYGDGYYYSAPDMEDEHPTVTVTNNGKDSALVVIKEWKDAVGTDLKENLPENIKVRLSIFKADGTEIPESLWNLYIQGGASNREVYLGKHNNWRHTWTIYQTKGVRYEVTEVEVPEGWKNDTPTVTAVKENGIWVVRLLNVLENAEVKIIKYDAKPPWSGLEGAEFDLYESDVRGISSQDHWKKINRQPLITDDKGEIMLKDIKLNTTYVLIETKPPKGFKQPTGKVIYFEVVTENGIRQLRFLNQQTDDNGGWDYFRYDPTTMAISIKNERITYTLPETGGAGTRGYKTGGALLMSIAALFYITQPMWMDEKRKRRASK